MCQYCTRTITPETQNIYNNHRKTLGYPPLTKDEIGREFTKTTLHQEQNPHLYLSANRYYFDDEGNMIRAF